MSEVMLSDTVTAQLQHKALKISKTPEELAERAVREFLRTATRQAIHQEVQMFRARHAELLQEYTGRYIAMVQGQVVDNDEDQLALWARIDDRYPHTPVLITPVVAEAEETYTVRSPRWEQGL